jgi:hypothetical protein
MSDRAAPGFIPGGLVAEYYSQRTYGGLLISEAIQISGAESARKAVA